MSHQELNPKIAMERLVRILRNKGISNEEVLEAFRKVPRHRFVDGAMYHQAYEDNALPIGLGQTISQPYIVALMTQYLSPQKNDKILEIGTGSGFQASILAHFTHRVFTIERHRELGIRSRNLLRELGYENIVFKIGDGTKGWAQYAPFDRIIVTAGAPVFPAELAKQLAVGGRLIVPVGDRNSQSLEIYDKTETNLKKTTIGGVVFVPLIGVNGWNN